MRKNRRLLRFFFVLKNKEGGSVMKNYKQKRKEDDAFGYYQIVEKRIGIRTNLSSLHTCKTIVHELAHSILHADMNNKISKSDKEIQAESVAYVTLNYFGFDTSDYSFPYVASHSNGKDVSELKESLQTIERCSRNLIDWLCEKTDLSQVYEV